MIKTIIDNYSKLEAVRDAFKQNKLYVRKVAKHYGVDVFTTGINVCEDQYSLRISLGVDKYTFYAIVRDNYHRIDAEFGINEFVNNNKFITREPKDFDEYMICSNLARLLVGIIYDVIELGSKNYDDEERNYTL